MGNEEQLSDEEIMRRTERWAEEITLAIRKIAGERIVFAIPAIPAIPAIMLSLVTIAIIEGMELNDLQEGIGLGYDYIRRKLDAMIADGAVEVVTVN